MLTKVIANIWECSNIAEKKFNEPKSEVSQYRLQANFNEAYLEEKTKVNVDL